MGKIILRLFWIWPSGRTVGPLFSTPAECGCCARTAFSVRCYCDLLHHAGFVLRVSFRDQDPQALGARLVELATYRFDGRCSRASCGRV